MCWYEGMKKSSQDKRSSNRESSKLILIERGVEFEEKNAGAHLVVKGPRCLVDFWPGTGKYLTRDGREGRGVFRLLKMMARDKKEQKNDQG